MSKLLNDSTASKIVTKKLIQVKDLSSDQYSVNKNMMFKTSMLRSNLCNYSDPYFVAKGKITVEGDNDDKKRNKKVIFKKNGPYRSCISKINDTYRGNAEDLDIVMPMYNLLEQSDDFSMKSGSLWNYLKVK